MGGVERHGDSTRQTGLRAGCDAPAGLRIAGRYSANALSHGRSKAAL